MRTSLVCFLLLGGCSMLNNEADTGSLLAAGENNPAFHARLLEIAAGYAAYARVDDELHWAPTLCRMPQPSSPRRSASANLETHGRKLYYVFAKDREAYLGRQGKVPAIVGQAVVKEAWTAEEVAPGTSYDTTQSPVRYLKEGDKLFHANKKSGLFIMYRLDPMTPDTDNGWVYGSVNGDDKTITSSGVVKTCAGCHRQAPHDGLFGIDYHGA